MSDACPLAGTSAWVYGHVHPETIDDLVVTGDVWIANEDGQVIAVLEGVHLARGNEATLLKSEHEHASDSYQITWQPEPLPTTPARTGRWLLLGDQQGGAQKVRDLLEQQGHTTVLVESAFPDLATAQACLQQSGPCTGIVHLGSLDSTACATLADLDAAHQRGCISVLHLVQALAEIGWSEAPRLVLVTQGVRSVDDDNQITGVAQSPLLGLGRVIQNEHPDLRCTLVGH
ncbi:MAG: hypothetical protein HC876_09790 [Chloroflexaceae bacterium]|nr:hypothetical protein [Chloroflexaceae bacterium]